MGVGISGGWAQSAFAEYLSFVTASIVGFVGATLAIGTTAVGSILGVALLGIPVVGWIAAILGVIFGKWIGNWIGSIFGGKKEITVTGTGIQLGAATVGGLLGGEGMTAQQYADIKEKKEGGWFHSTSRKYYTLYQELDEDVTRLLTKVFVDLGATLVELSIALGTDTQATLDYVFPGGKINLAGLDAEGIDKAISEFISGAADDAVEALFGQMLRSYQQVGEGLLETAVRLVIDKEIILDTLKMTGQAFVGSTSEIIAFSEAIIEMAGDLKTLREAAETYYDKFFDDAEKQVRLQGQLAGVFTDMNMVLPSTREGYRYLVEGLDLTTEAGQRAYVSLLTLAEGADAYYEYLEEAAAESLSIAESDLKAAFSAEKDRLTEIYNASLETLNLSLTETQSVISDLEGYVGKLKGARERMALESVDYERNQYRVAQAILAYTLQQARLGDFGGVKDIDKTLDTLTGASTDLYATFVDYQRDYWKTYLSIEELEDLTGNQLSVEEQTLALQQKQIELLGNNYQAELAAMDVQLNALLGINTSVLSLPQAIANLIAAQLALTAAGGAPPTPAVQSSIVDQLYSTILGRTTEEAGATFWKGQIAGGESINSIMTDFIYSSEFQQRNATDLIGGIYEALLGREADIGGRAFYEAGLVSGRSLTDIIAEILGSPEYGGIRSARGFQSGGYHPGGWRMVGEGGPELEYTGPSNIIPFKKSVGDSELISEIRQLREEMKRGNYTIAKNTGKLAKINDRWDVDGLPSTREI